MHRNSQLRSRGRGAVGVGLAGGASLALLTMHGPGCSVDLGPLVQPDASSDATACPNCDDATADGDGACPEGRVRFPSGQCCFERFTTPLPGGTAAGVVLHDEDAIVYGTKNERAWAARVSRCDGALLGETTSIVTQTSAAYAGDLAGDQLVIAGRVGDTASNSRSLVAWGDATALSQFAVDIGSSSIASRADGVELRGAGEAWVATTTKPSTSSSRAQLKRVNTGTNLYCAETLGSDTGIGMSVTLGETAVWFAIIQSFEISLYREIFADCFAGTCDCSTPGKLQIAAQAGFVLDLPRVRAVPGGVVLIASTSNYGYTAGGSQITRVSDDLTVSASLSFPPAGSGFDRLWDIEHTGTELIVGGAWRCDSFGSGLCDGGRLFALSPSFSDTSLSLWERSIAALERVTGVRREPEATGGLVVVGQSRSNPADAMVMRCSADGSCEPG